MKTNQNGHTLRNLTNRVIAVIDDPLQTQAAIATLERAGIEDRDLAAFSGEEGARQIDAEGVYSGGVTHILRTLRATEARTRSFTFSARTGRIS